jgi:hypothetical protein
MKNDYLNVNPIISTLSEGLNGFANYLMLLYNIICESGLNFVHTILYSKWMVPEHPIIYSTPPLGWSPVYTAVNRNEHGD